MDAYARYREDQNFRSLVDLMTSFLIKAEFTPSEVRLASMLASINYEMTRVPRYLVTSEIEETLGRLEKQIDKVKDNE